MLNWEIVFWKNPLLEQIIKIQSCQFINFRIQLRNVDRKQLEQQSSLFYCLPGRMTRRRLNAWDSVKDFRYFDDIIWFPFKQILTWQLVLLFTFVLKLPQHWQPETETAPTTIVLLYKLWSISPLPIVLYCVINLFSSDNYHQLPVRLVIFCKTTSC